MRLNLQTDYALRILVVLGASPGTRWSLPQLAGAYEISLDHLRKVCQRLHQGNMVITTRGRGGGVELGPDGLNLSIGQVVRWMEPDLALVECMGDNNHCKLTGACSLYGVLNRARANFLSELDAVKLRDVVRNRSAIGAALGLELAPAEA
jgi:Rrf2 family nitric oxide-sensitive transcriptional repressor